MNPYRFACWASVNIILAATALVSYAADTKELTQQLISEPFVRKNILETAAEAGVMVEHPCPTMSYVVRPTVEIYDPLAFDAKGIATEGAWLAVVDAKGCGVSRVLNIAVIVEGPGKLNFASIFPGDTHASVGLQGDALDYAIDRAMKAGGAREAGCKLHYIKDSQYVGTDGPVAPNTSDAPWREIWSVETCKHVYLVPMKFKPTATGTDFSADVAAIKIQPRGVN